MPKNFTKFVFSNTHKVLLFTLIIASATLIPNIFNTTATPQKSFAGYWRGTSNARRETNLNVAILKQNYQSDFWFIIDNQGNISGQAVVNYDISLDDSKLRGILTVVNTTSAVTLSAIPEIGSLLGANAATKDLIGVTTKYDEILPVRGGEIAGKLAGDTLHLEWKTPPSDISYSTFKVYPLKELTLKKGSTPAYSPWVVNAKVQQLSNGQWQAMTDLAQSHKQEGDKQTFYYWTAYKINGS